MTEVDLLFRATFHDSPIGMAVLDELGNYIDVNSAFCSIIEYERSEILGRNFGHFTHPDDLPRDIELLNQLAQADFPSYQTQKRYRTKSNDTVWVRVTVVTVRTEGADMPPHFVVQVEDITEARNARALLESRAYYDALTGLATRALMLDRITKALAAHADRTDSVALVFVDIDHFKLVNDSLGHNAGDHLLAVTAQRLQSSVRRGDTVGRIGGDEFVVLLENVASEDEAEARASLIARGAQLPVNLSDHEVVPTISAGVAFVDEDIDAETLLRAADTAMYAAKQGGRAGLKIYDSNLKEQITTRLQIEEELRGALREGDLRVHYQPVVDLQQLKIVGYEALVRWEHPDRGLLMPNAFMGAAMQAGLIVPIGSFVTHEVCKEIAEHPEFTGQMYVNVAPRQIGTAGLAAVVERALTVHGVAPGRLCIEISEAGVLASNALARQDIDAVAHLGVDLAIDDFGTSYAELSSMVRHPISRIKLAVEFAARLGDDGFGDRISLAAAGLTRALGVTGIVEGLETPTQFARARVHGWQLGQGYLFGRAVPIEDIDFSVTDAHVPATAPD